MLSTKNLPEPVNSTAVPLSIKMPRSIATPECKRTGQSTINVKAPCLAAANASMAPEVSSETREQNNQSQIDSGHSPAAASPPAPSDRPSAIETTEKGPAVFTRALANALK